MRFLEIKSYNDDLQNYIKSRIKNDGWKDVYQDTIVYLLSQEDKEVSNLKGYILNAGRFFVYNYFNRQKKTIKYVAEYSEKNVPVVDIENVKVGNIDYGKFDDKQITVIGNANRSGKSMFLEMIASGFSNKEIAMTFEMNENTLRTRLNRMKNDNKRAIRTGI